MVRPTVPEPVSDDVARIRFGWTGVTVVGSSRPVAPRMSRVQAPSASAVAMPNSWPVAEPSSYVRLMVWFGTLLEPVTTQRFLSVRNSALDTITVSESTAFTVTVAMFADWAPALSTARYVNVYVPAAAALKVTTPPAPAVAVAPAGWLTITTPTMSEAPSGSVSFAIRLGSAVATPLFTVKGPSLTAVGASFTAVMLTVTLAIFDGAAVPTATW